MRAVLMHLRSLGRGRRATVVVAVMVTALAAPLVVSAASGRTTKQTKVSRRLERLLSRRVDQRVIIFLRAQATPARAGTSAFAAQAAAARTRQAPLISQLRRSHARNIRSMQLVSAIAATVSKAELGKLRHNAAVQSVIRDRTIQIAQPSAPATVKAHAASGGSLTPNVIPGACSSTTPQLDPEGLSLTNTDSDNPNQPTARSLGIDGTGVKVAYIADGIDPNNINFIRANGTTAFVDYQDFSGDGPGQPTTGGEAFLDANTIAGQGLHTYDVNGFSAQPDPGPCLVRIEGVAPGASLVGLNVFGSFEDTTQSNFLEAINYAVETDHVNVINESFGSNPFPDVTSLDATKQFNDAAVAAGVFISVSSGDAGPFDTLSSGATDPAVMDVGASTDLRFYAQTNYAAARYFATTGWLSNQISSLSSSGFSETGQTLDMIAPGELSFASCDASPEYADCINFLGQPAVVERSGGTSQSSPFVAGAAALVIQAYRKTHGGATPSPALIKQILLSTATDLGAPASEEGAGLLNSYKAVQLAESIPTADGTPAPTGNTLLTSPNQLNAVGAPGRSEQWPVTVTNTGSSSQTLQLSSHTFGSDQNVQTGTVTLSDSTSPQFLDFDGVEANYGTFTFTVPSGADRLVSSLAYPNNPALGNNNRVRMILIDPTGKLAAHSLPQGVGGYGNVDIVHPAAGTWTGVIFSDVSTSHGSTGTVSWRAATENYTSFGSVSPASLTLAPGQSGQFHVTDSTPSSPGDAAGSVVINSSTGDTTTIPVTLRSLIEPAGNPGGNQDGNSQGGANGGFSGTLTGGNGRPPGQGQEQYYEFDVPSGVHDITANVAFATDPSIQVAEFLVSPDGDTLGYGVNSVNGKSGTAVSAYTLNPAPGRWTLIVAFTGAVPGDVLAQPFAGNVRFDTVHASASGLPHGSAKLPAGAPVSATVRITNTGIETEDYVLDPRLNQNETITLAPFAPATVGLPLVGGEPFWLVPTETSSVAIAQTSSLPATFDWGPFPGDPDIAASATATCTTSATAGYTPPGGLVTAGFWGVAPTECGPYPVPAPAGTATDAMTAVTKTIDPAVATQTGDIWQGSVNPAATFSPLVLAPGQSGTVRLTITPSGASGSTVSGAVYVDAFVAGFPISGSSSADEVASFPYGYRIR